MLEGEAYERSGRPILARKKLTLLGIVRFLEEWWSPEAVAPVRDRFVKECHVLWNHVPGQEALWLKHASAASYTPEELKASPGLRRGVRLGTAVQGARQALAVHDFIHETIGSMNRGPVMARAEKEWSNTLVTARIELAAIADDPTASSIGREIASQVVSLLRVVDDVDDPVVGATWPVERKNLIFTLYSLEGRGRRRYCVPPPDPPAPARARELFQGLLDHRRAPDLDTRREEELRLAYADAIEAFDPALAVFLRGQADWSGGENSRFEEVIVPLGPITVGAFSPMDVVRWVEPVAPYVTRLRLVEGLIRWVQMTLPQLLAHGNEVMNAAAITRLDLSLDGAATPDALDFLRTSDVFAPIHTLRIPEAFAHPDVLYAVLANPSTSNLRELHLLSERGGGEAEMEAAAAFTRYFADNRHRFPRLDPPRLRFDGTEILIISKRLEEARRRFYDTIDYGDNYLFDNTPFFTPDPAWARFEPSPIARRLEATYGPLPWLRYSDDKRAELLSTWANIDPNRPYDGPRFWRDE